MFSFLLDLLFKNIIYLFLISTFFKLPHFCYGMFVMKKK